MREYPPHPLPAALAMVVRDGTVLLVQRAVEPDYGKWGFPGGMVEAGETVLAAAERELLEETGILAQAEREVDTFELVTRDAEGRARYHYRVGAVLCRWRAGEGKAGPDALALGWFAPRDIPALPTSANLARLVETILGR
jgi:8-oxo-dGTP diphosphatase